MNGAASYSADQVADVGELLGKELSAHTLHSVGLALLGPDIFKDVGNVVADRGAMAQFLINRLHAAGRLAEAITFLRNEAHASSYLIIALNHILRGRRLSDSAALQALRNTYEPFLKTLATHQLLPKIMRTVCAIGLGAPHCKIIGTGFLVGADRVLTNFHVVEPFLSVKSDHSVVQNGAELYFYFDYHAEPAPKVPPDAAACSVICVAAANDWLIHARESLANDGTDAVSAVNTEYDYALIKLARPIGSRPSRPSGGALRGWLPLPATIDPFALNQRVMVFQHPQGIAQRWDIGEYVGLDPSGSRVRYTVSSAHGSSGGAAIDTEGRVFALHNAEVKSSNSNEKLNQGVRIDLIVKDLTTHVPVWNPAPPVETDAFHYWSLTDDVSNPQPIIGRTLFRDHVEQMSTQDGGRVLVVSGAPGSGVRFSSKLLRRILGIQSHIVEFSPLQLAGFEPAQFLDMLVNRLGLLTDGVAMPEPQATEGLSRWVRLDVPRWLKPMLTVAARNEAYRYPAWIVIDTILPPESLLKWTANRDLVAALMGVHDPGQEFVDLPELRWLVLSRHAAPFSLAEVSYLEEEISDLTRYEDEFVQCMQLAWRCVESPDEADKLEVTQRTLARVANILNQKAPENQRQPLREALATHARLMVMEGLQIVGKTAPRSG